MNAKIELRKMLLQGVCSTVGAQGTEHVQWVLRMAILT